MNRTGVSIWNTDTLVLTGTNGASVTVVSRLPDGIGILVEDELATGGPLTLIITTMDEAQAVEDQRLKGGRRT